MNYQIPNMEIIYWEGKEVDTIQASVEGPGDDVSGEGLF